MEQYYHFFPSLNKTVLHSICCRPSSLYKKSVYLPFLQEILLVSILLNSMCTHHLLPFLKYLSIFYFLYFSLKGT
ncbi:GTP cyclohydrolase I [Priestia aryabhattai]|nr:GTP cyclohydrolase I [Priestia aryabhattai]